MGQSRKEQGRPTYTAQEKAWAMTAVLSGRTQREVAGVLGCSDREVRRWLRQADIDAGRRRGLKSHERRELFELRRTVQRQEERIRLMEEAQDFFATETR